MKIHTWYDAVALCEQQGDAYVLATVMGAAGSVPRDQGSKMVITADKQFDTLGGGHLEFQVMQHAQQLLADQSTGNFVEHFPLGASLGQCCGGSVSVLFESVAQKGMNLTVFGAGHVANALMSILSQLPGKIRWVDSRPNFLNQNEYHAIEMIHTQDPVDVMHTLPANSQVLVLTHNHQLDFELVKCALERGDFSYLGCIGSHTKAQRFKLRLQHKGIKDEMIANLMCPVGDTRIPGKLPIQVAVSIAAQLMQHWSVQPDKRTTKQGVSWQSIKQDLLTENVQSNTPNKIQ